VKAAWF